MIERALQLALLISGFFYFLFSGWGCWILMSLEIREELNKFDTLAIINLLVLVGLGAISILITIVNYIITGNTYWQWLY